MSNITIEQIISYLSTNDNSLKKLAKQIKLLNKNETENSDKFPINFKNIFDNNVYRMGIIHEKKTSKNVLNVSLYSSVLHCIDNQFHILPNIQQLNNINEFVNKMCYDIDKDKLYSKFKYRKLKIKKQELIFDIINYKNTLNVVLFLSDYFNINIFLFNFKTKKIKCIYSQQHFNKYKQNVFLAQIDKHSFEPIHSKSNINFSYSNNIFIKLLNCKNILTMNSKIFKLKNDNDINSLIKETIDKEKVDNDNETNIDTIIDTETDTIIDTEKKVEIDKVETKVEIEKVETKVEIDKVETVEIDKVETKIKPKYNIRFKLSKLQDLAIKYNIELNKSNKNKKKTKKELINDLDLYFSS